MRWKIFIPLAILLTAAGLLGSFYWSNITSTRYLSRLDSLEADVALEGKTVTITINDGQALSDIFNDRDDVQLPMTNEGQLKIFRGDMLPIDSSLSQQVQLILAQAVATKEYYQASLLLRELATDRGYGSEMLIWQGMLIVEITDARHSYIALKPVQEVMAHD